MEQKALSMATEIGFEHLHGSGMSLVPLRRISHCSLMMGLSRGRAKVSTYHPTSKGQAL